MSDELPEYIDRDFEAKDIKDIKTPDEDTKIFLAKLSNWLRSNRQN